MSRLIGLCRHLAWPLALLTTLLVAAAALALNSVVSTWARGEPQPGWYAGVFLALVGVLGVWHRYNLGQYISLGDHRSPGYVFSVAHVGGTACVFAAAYALLLLAGLLLAWPIDRLINSEGVGRGLFTGLMTLAMFPASYFPGRIVANLLAGHWANAAIPETDVTSPHHPQRQFEVRSPTDYLVVSTDHSVSFLLTWIPTVIVAVSGVLVYAYRTIPSPAVARCMAAAEDLRWMVEDRPDPAVVRQAIGWYDEAIRLDPTHAPAYLWRGHAYRRLREYEKSRADYATATRLDPGLGGPTTDSE